MGRKLTGKTLAKFESKRDVWQEILAGVWEIKAGGGKRTKIQAKSCVLCAHSPCNCTLLPFCLQKT